MTAFFFCLLRGKNAFDFLRLGGSFWQAISWLGDPLKFGLSRVMDICRKCSTDLDVNAGTAKEKVSFQVPSCNVVASAVRCARNDVRYPLIKKRQKKKNCAIKRAKNVAGDGRLQPGKTCTGFGYLTYTISGDQSK